MRDNVGDLIVAFRRAMKTERDNLATQIATGCCVSFENYQRMVGKMDGLDIAEGILSEADRKLRKSSDED